MNDLKYDVVVIGAGPAGCSAAKAAAVNGIRVLLIDKKTTIGIPVRCAEYVPKLLMREIEDGWPSVVQEVTSMRTYLPGGEVAEIQAPGYMLDRRLFDQALANQAAAKGVDILLQSQALRSIDGGILVRCGKQQLFIQAKVIVGADGPTSTVGCWMEQENRKFVYAAQYQVPLLKRMEWTEIYFDRDFPGGYAWVFPKGSIANVGVGIAKKFNINPRRVLRKFMRKLVAEGKINGHRIIGFSAGLVPVGGPPGRTYNENMLLVGDAAGQAHPITGAGIAPAVICGKIAGEVAGRAIMEKNLEVLRDYEKQWKSFLGAALDKAKQKRTFLEEHWDSDDLDGLIRQCWVAFKEYRSEDRQ